MGNRSPQRHRVTEKYYRGDAGVGAEFAEARLSIELVGIQMLMPVVDSRFFLPSFARLRRSTTPSREKRACWGPRAEGGRPHVSWALLAKEQIPRCARNDNPA